MDNNNNNNNRWWWFMVLGEVVTFVPVFQSVKEKKNWIYDQRHPLCVRAGTPQLCNGKIKHLHAFHMEFVDHLCLLAHKHQYLKYTCTRAYKIINSNSPKHSFFLCMVVKFGTFTCQSKTILYDDNEKITISSFISRFGL